MGSFDASGDSTGCAKGDSLTRTEVRESRRFVQRNWSALFLALVLVLLRTLPDHPNNRLLDERLAYDSSDERFLIILVNMLTALCSFSFPDAI